MFHFTIFGGSEVTLSGQGQFIVTLFGGTDVRKPTLAKRLMQERHALSSGKSDPNYNPNNVDKFLNVLQGNTPTGLPRTGKLLELERASLLEETGRRLRALGSAPADA